MKIKGLLLLLCLSLLSITASGKEQTVESHLVVNQLGYPLLALKRAYWIDAKADNVSLMNMHTGKVKQYPVNINSVILGKKQTVSTIDFSQLEEPGWYRFKAGRQLSAPFHINDDVYHPLLYRLIRALYLQRCGVEIEDRETGMSRPPSHTHDALIFRTDKVNKKNTWIDVNGGWYDAGDFGKYVATTTITVAHLLEAYRQAPQLFTTDFFQPEMLQKEALPYILQEAKIGLTWLEKMQRSDGAVYRKVSGKHWPKVIAPWNDIQLRYIFGVSSPDTAKFAATLAFASRIYRPFEPKLAKRYLNAAIKAWTFLAMTPKQFTDWKKEDDSGSGPYISNEHDTETSLLTDVDDRLWALAELYLATKETQYKQTFLSLYSSEYLDIFEWKNPALMGIWHLILTQESAFKLLQRDLHAKAAQYAQVAQSQPFFVANDRFIWGSNKMVAEVGLLLAWSSQLSNTHAQYGRYSQSQLDYLLGANAFNLSFVTGFGSRSVKNIHHLYQNASGVHIPGFLVGGPNEHAQAGIAPKGLGMLSYVDHEKSYAVNEFAIDYNASLIGLLAAQSAALKQGKRER
ncbi:glycoside hydrolase family 9 protein [uncultured Shewanella sp.]|uniref:glycoside hydrolase family 9 protein n=1 Tax=uncultured Shewanella sp. TaxID=173975 RepID=UPI00261C2A82|nr:glycoside hydrolase family 9 protein [uncultured Shewanella sp.]